MLHRIRASGDVTREIVFHFELFSRWLKFTMTRVIDRARKNSLGFGLST